MNINIKDVYEQCLKKYEYPISFLELGVNTGYSLRKWKEMCYTNSKLYGMDITYKNLQIDSSEFTLFTGNILDKNQVDFLLKNLSFHIILHDACPLDHVEIFSNFHPYLKNNGTFIFENFRPRKNENISMIKSYLLLKNTFPKFNFEIPKNSKDFVIICQKYII
jgi:SAM-dependent methyltransferase